MRLRVLTINIWNRMGPWEQRLPLLRKGIEALAPDLVAVQEVIRNGDRTQADDLAEGLGYTTGFGSSFDVGEGGAVQFGNAVLSRFPLSKLQSHLLPRHHHEEQRSVLSVRVEAPFGSLPFYMTHLAWRFNEGPSREKQLLAIAKLIQEQDPVDSGPAPILAGDLNAQPEATEIRFLKGLHSLEGMGFFMTDCFERVGEGPGATFDAKRNPFAAITYEPPRRIDYVFVRGPDRDGKGMPIACRVVLDTVENGVAPSDHFGVLAELEY